MISVRNNIKFSRSYLSNLLLITMCIKLQSCMVLSEQPDQVCHPQQLHALPHRGDGECSGVSGGHPGVRVSRVVPVRVLHLLAVGGDAGAQGGRVRLATSPLLAHPR